MDWIQLLDPTTLGICGVIAAIVLAFIYGLLR